MKNLPKKHGSIVNPGICMLVADIYQQYNIPLNVAANLAYVLTRYLEVGFVPATEIKPETEQWLTRFRRRKNFDLLKDLITQIDEMVYSSLPENS